MTAWQDKIQDPKEDMCRLLNVVTSTYHLHGNLGRTISEHWGTVNRPSYILFGGGGVSEEARCLLLAGKYQQRVTH